MGGVPDPNDYGGSKSRDGGLLGGTSGLGNDTRLQNPGGSRSRRARRRPGTESKQSNSRGVPVRSNGVINSGTNPFALIKPGTSDPRNPSHSNNNTQLDKRRDRNRALSRPSGGPKPSQSRNSDVQLINQPETDGIMARLQELSDQFSQLQMIPNLQLELRHLKDENERLKKQNIDGDDDIFETKRGSDGETSDMPENDVDLNESNKRSRGDRRSRSNYIQPTKKKKTLNPGDVDIPDETISPERPTLSTPFKVALQSRLPTPGKPLLSQPDEDFVSGGENDDVIELET